MKFSYERFPPDDDPVYFPTLKVTVINPKTKKPYLDYKVLVDSGAVAPVFHAWVGEAIGLDIKKGKKLRLLGVTTGKGEQFVHEVDIIVGGNEIKLEVGFSYNLKFPFGLLGQRGFFEKNRICFDLPVGDFEINPKTRKR